MARPNRALSSSGVGSANDIKVFLDPSTKSLILEESKKRGISQSQYCREIIERHIDWMLDGKESEFRSHLAFAKGQLQDLEKTVKYARDVLSEM